MESDGNSGSERTKAFDLDRTIALSDGIFAFALTLLVLSISVPDIASGSSSSELWAALQNREQELISYLISFAVIGSFWVRHHKLCGSLKDVDGPFVAINLVYLATIAFIPYPTQVLGDFQNSAGFAFYAAAISISMLVSVGLNEHAIRGSLLQTTPDQIVLKDQRTNGVAVIGGFIISIPLVLLTGELWLGYLCWILGANSQLLLRAIGSGKH
ncbi:MAG: TMEM175 family protein [Solirubrobacteraceae bacterium]|nr:TMEM175 family protein [Solirubrobacteraceae bacterium]MDP4921374.1 TMEM175 family protein [Solirubrobacteraceae bacterium]MDP5034414.1 TMEM175 family protein [Solirubrobacteraceae bacterium]